MNNKHIIKNNDNEIEELRQNIILCMDMVRFYGSMECDEHDKWRHKLDVYTKVLVRKFISKEI